MGSDYGMRAGVLRKATARACRLYCRSKTLCVLGEGEGVRTALERRIDVHVYSGEVAICIHDHERRYDRHNDQYYLGDKD